MKEITITQENIGNLIICAIRYCQGRQTYMPSVIQRIGRLYLRDLSDNDLKVLIDDCDFQEKMQTYGDERIDKPGWIQWRADLMKEAERREAEQ